MFLNDRIKNKTLNQLSIVKTYLDFYDFIGMIKSKGSVGPSVKISLRNTERDIIIALLCDGT